MVTVWMAILIFMGVGWQFAFEQWGKVDSTMVFTYPIGFKTEVVYVSSIHIGESPDPNRTISLSSLGLNSVKVLTNVPSDYYGFLLAIGH